MPGCCFLLLPLPFAHIKKLNEERKGHSKVEVLFLNVVMQSIGYKQYADHEQEG